MIGGDHDPTLKAMEAMPPSRRWGLIWARIVCAEEEIFAKDCWRNSASPSRADYLLHLVDLGYELGEPEQLIVDKAEAAAESGDLDDDDGVDEDLDDEAGGDLL